MCGEGSRRAAELAEILGGLDLRDDATEAADEDCELLAHRGGCRGLTVCVREHGVAAVVHSPLVECVDHGVRLRQPDVPHGGTDGEGVGEIVDVFTGAGEVRELGNIRETEVDETLADVVLDRLHVVASRRLEGGEFVDVSLAEVRDELAQRPGLLGIQSSRSEEFAVGQIQKPLDLDMHASPVEARLGEVLAEFDDGGPVAAVERTQWLFWQWAHETPRRIPGSIWRKSAALDFSIIPRTLPNMAASE